MSVMEYDGIWVPGDPKTKGSWVPVKAADGRIKFRPATKGTSKWCKDAVAAIAAQWRGPLLDGPVRARFLFLLPKPPTVTRAYPTSSRDGDVDKLIRALFDAMTGTVYRDDGQVVDSSEKKRYATGETGAWIYIDTDV